MGALRSREGMQLGSGWRGAVSSVNLTDLLDEAVQRWGSRELLLSEGGSVTYREFADRVARLAGGLAAQGIRSGHRVAVLLPNRPEILYTWFALARLGAAMMPVHPDLVPVQVEPMLRLSGVDGLIALPETLFAHGEGLDLVLKVVVGKVDLEGCVSFDRLFDAPPAPAHPCAPGDLTTLLQTSGTTGDPKLAALSHATYVLPAREFVRWMEVTPRDRFLACLPLFHMAGGAFAISAVAGGAALAMVEKFSAHGFWRQVRLYRATLVRHLGEMLAVLCKLPGPQEHDHTLRAVYGGGARRSVAEEFEQRFGVQVIEGYGLTETNTVLRNRLASRRLGSIGQPLPYGPVRIADPDGRTLPPGEVGEIQVRRNPVMMAGYWGRPELTAGCFSGNWFHTRDLGYRDEEDFFYFVGRDRDIVRRRGENIVPREVEEVLERHPDVSLSAVVGYPDGVGGEEVKAYVVLRPGRETPPGELVEWCHSFLAEFQVPRYLELSSSLPRTATNKINKSQLRVLGTLGGGCFDRRAEGAELSLQAEGAQSVP